MDNLSIKKIIKKFHKKHPINCKCPFHKDNHGKNHPFWGKHLTKKHKNKISKKMKGRFIGSLHNNFGKPPKWKIVKYKNVSMRSTWESKYANYLDNKNVKWLYESKTFDLGEYTYTPDFYLPETDEYIEIKGYFREEAKRKFKIFKKLYPKIKITILMKSDLKLLKIL